MKGRTRGLAAVVLTAIIVSSSASPATSAYRAFGDRSFWNRALPETAPRHPYSDQIIAFLLADNDTDYISLAGTSAGGEWGMPVYWPDDTTRVYDVGKNCPVDQPPEFNAVPIPRGAKPDPTSDAAMTIVDRNPRDLVWLPSRAIRPGPGPMDRVRRHGLLPEIQRPAPRPLRLGRPAQPRTPRRAADRVVRPLRRDPVRPYRSCAEDRRRPHEVPPCLPDDRRRVRHLAAVRPTGGAPDPDQAVGRALAIPAQPRRARDRAGLAALRGDRRRPDRAGRSS